MLRELRVSEMGYRAVFEVLDGAVISTVARQYGGVTADGACVVAPVCGLFANESAVVAGGYPGEGVVSLS
jgi:hypothetical protein